MRIEFARVRIDRGGAVAVDGAAGTFAEHCWSGLIGANGSGKTSLLRALSGRLPVTAGTVRMAGREQAADRIWRAANIGFAPDVSALPDGLTGGQFLGLVRRTADGDEAARVLSRLREALRFDPFLHRPIGALSAGMRQRIAIFAAFADLARTVILDEPFNWLDPVCAHDTKAALRELVDRREVTLVTALHELSTLTVFCDAGLLMSEGRVVRLLDRDALARGAADIARFEAEIVGHLRDQRAS